MKKMFCDRCKKEFPVGTGVNFSPNESPILHTLGEFDLCGNCVKLLCNWLKGELTPKQTTT